MKKSIKGLICAATVLAMVAPCALTACKTKEVVTDEYYELSCYKGEDKDTSGNIIYNTSLFYSNSLQQGYPDPQVLDDTGPGRSGYYYLYGTSNFQTMRSKDLAVWEPVKVVLDFSEEIILKTINTHRWAPEVIYDDDTRLYYLFFSAVPDLEYRKITESGGDVYGDVTMYNMYVATSTSPEGPFTMVDFSDETNCGAGNVHNLNTVNSHQLSAEEVKSGEYAAVERDGKYYEAAFRQYYAKYCLFAPDELSKLLYKNQVGSGGIFNESPDARYFQTIDPHPFVDPVTQKKYMYFKLEDKAAWNINIGVEMENWLKPIWSTAKYITADRFYTIQDWREGAADRVTYEYGGVCNEGACMLYHDGKYYFTFSVNDYQSSDYQVGMAVADSPLGDFRKLKEEEGGLLLCSNTTGSESVSGAGHHSFVTVGDQLFIAYHRHKDYTHPSADRYTAVDEVKWITVKDENDDDLVIPYVNGPTDSLQPLPEKISGYKNIAPQATVTCTDETAETDYLTDGLLSVHKSADDTFMDYIKETKIKQTATFGFDFETPTTVRAILVYNSVKRKEIFYNIPKIQFTLADDSVREIRNVKFDIEQYCRMGGANNSEALYVMSGAAAFAEFYDVSVKSIKITVEVPKNQTQVGISEIKILGKA